ncbi:MAG: c-type cytochrome domain-containing protein, partial [Planctomycetaceae bacterium]
ELLILERWIRGGAPEFAVTELPSQTQPGPFSKSAAAVKEVFVQHCYECHKHGVARGGIRILHHRLLVNIRKVVVPGRPDQSELLQLLLTNSRRVMPPPPGERLTDDEVHIVRQWIAAGASPFPGQ